MNQAISLALATEMRADPSVVLFGEDVAHAGGPFKTSEGLLDEFGALRVRDTPISEMGFLGAAVGSAAKGLRPVAEIMFVEFIGVALDQIATGAAKLHYLSGGRISVPLVVRASVGAGLGFGCQHSQSLEQWFMGTPGLKVCAASGARSAYGLLRSAIRDPNPVVMLEPRVLYGQREEFDPSKEVLMPLGRAEVLADGTDVTLVGFGGTVRIAQEAAEAAQDWSSDLIDLRTLVPWDTDTLLRSVRRTGRLILIEEGPASGSWGAVIASFIGSGLFGHLKAPVLRITSPDVPVPHPPELERRYVPSVEYVLEQVDHLVRTGLLPAPWWERKGA